MLCVWLSVAWSDLLGRVKKVVFHQRNYQKETTEILKYSTSEIITESESKIKMFILTLCGWVQVRLTNPSAKMLSYTALITGHDSPDFWLPKGDVITVPRKGKAGLTIEFRSRFLRSAKAVLILVGKRLGASIGSTLVFNLCTQIDSIKPKVGAMFTREILCHYNARFQGQMQQMPSLTFCPNQDETFV